MRPDAKFWKRSFGLKIAAVALAAFAILLAVIYFAPVEHSWVDTKRALESRGESLDWSHFIPPLIPDADNLYSDPVAASLLPLKGQNIPANPLNVSAPSFPPNTSILGVPFTIERLTALPRESSSDKEVSLDYLRDWFSQWDQSFAQLRVAALRPGRRLDGDYKTPASVPILNFVSIRNLAQVLASQAKVHLVLGESAAAFRDLETLRVVMSALDSPPVTLVSAMIQVAVAGLYLDTVEEGLRRNLWAEPELPMISAQLLEINLLLSVKQAIRSERAAILRHLTAIAERRRDPLYSSTLDAFTQRGWNLESVFIRVAPSSWIRRNQADYARLLQAYIDAIADQNLRVDLDSLAAVNAEVTRLLASKSPRNTLLRYVLPNFSKALDTLAKNQNRAGFLAIVCALRSCHAQRHSYPAGLSELRPAFIPALPTDVYSGASFLYHRTVDGFELSNSGTNSATTTILEWVDK